MSGLRALSRGGCQGSLLAVSPMQWEEERLSALLAINQHLPFFACPGGQCLPGAFSTTIFGAGTTIFAARGDGWR